MDSVERFIHELKSGSVSTRRYAVEMLGRLGDPRAIDPLIEALEKDEALEVRGDAAVVLVGFDDERAVNAVIRALDDEYPWVRIHAASALSKVRSPAAVEALANAVRNSDVESVRIIAAQSLGEIGDPRAVDALSHAVQHDASFEVRIAAAESLGMIGDPRAIDALGTVFKTRHRRLRTTAIDALSKIGDPRAIEFVCQSLDSPDRFEKEAALKFLGRFRRDVRMLKPLANAARNSPRPAVFEYIAEVLHPFVITQPDAILALSADDRRALEDAAWQGREARLLAVLCLQDGGDA